MASFAPRQLSIPVALARQRVPRRAACHVPVLGQQLHYAVQRGRRALDEFVIEGIQTTIPFHRRVLDNAAFCAGDVTTDFIETQMGDVL